MTEPSSTFEILKTIGAYLITGLLFILGSIVAWFGKKQVDKVENIDKTYISREEHTATVNSLRTEINKGFDRIHDRLDKLK